MTHVKLLDDNLRSRSNEDKEIGTRMWCLQIKQPIILTKMMMAMRNDDNDDDDGIDDDDLVGILGMKSSAFIFGWREEHLTPNITSRRPTY